MEYVIKSVALLFLFMVAMTDVKTKKVSLKIIILFGLAAVALIIIAMASGEEINILSSLGGLALGLAFVLLSKVTSGAMGEGDGFVIATVGLYVGFAHNLEILFIAFLAAAFVGIVLWITKEKKRKESMAFVPFILAGYLVSLI